MGGLKQLKTWLEDTFDHKVVVDSADPEMGTLFMLEQKGIAALTELDGVGAEKFAYHAWKFANLLVDDMTEGRCWCQKVEVAEHGANSAIYERT